MKMGDILIKGGTVVETVANYTKVADVLIRNGKIEDIQRDISSVADDVEIIDAKGLYIFPGLVDMHVHFRDPGYLYKEDIMSGSEAAAAGGITSVACMPNTDPAVDNGETLEYIKEKALNAKINIYPIAGITRNIKENKLNDFELLKKCGAVAFSNDGYPVSSAKVMKKAMEEAYALNVPIISHCEDSEISADGVMNEGEISAMLGLEGIHRSAEDTVTAREIALAAATGTAVHIAHVSTRGAVALIRDAKSRNVKVTAETCPHYFMLDHKKLLLKDADYKMNPPLRTREDIIAVRLGVIDGTIDCIATDHAPHTAEEKTDFMTAPNGVIGLETSLAAALTTFYHTKMLSMEGIAKIMCANPAKILGIEAGFIYVGKPADLAIVDVDEEWEVIPEKLYSRSRNTPFKRMKLKGKVKYTVCNGKIIFKDGER